MDTTKDAFYKKDEELYQNKINQCNQIHDEVRYRLLLKRELV